ncbi:hypothetical protein BJ912DRAFT_117455 [Pholiota molesta]|nr:hypothetical protein BJ912DRAFT_117455 [Pholiota molesta]
MQAQTPLLGPDRGGVSKPALHARLARATAHPAAHPSWPTHRGPVRLTLKTLQRQSTSRREPSDRRDFKDVDSGERVPEIPTIDPTTSDHLDHRASLHRAAAGNNQDEQLHVPPGRPTTGYSLSESMNFDNIKHSGISIGSGPVNVSNTSLSLRPLRQTSRGSISNTPSSRDSNSTHASLPLP